jgi:Membrane transport protein MerF
VFLLGAVGLAFLNPYLDYVLFPLFAIFLLLALYGWMRAATSGVAAAAVLINQ